jgi:Protein of unknown function (DUF3421)
MTTMNKKCLSNWLTALGIAVLSLGSLVTMTQSALADHKWVEGRMGFVPKDAVKAGWDGGDLYVCSNYNTKTSSLYKGRPFYSSGKLHPKYGKCFTSYSGQEFGVTTYQVLTGTRLRWVTLTGTMPPNAITGGTDDDGSRLYVCRAWFQFGDQRLRISGKFNTNHDRCYVPYGGKEHASQYTQILIDDEWKY